MRNVELAHIAAGILVLFAVAALSIVLKGDWIGVIEALVFAFVIIGVNVVAKKMMARALDADVEHRIWHVYRYGWRPRYHFKKEIPFGVIVPLIVAVFSLLVLWPLGIVAKCFTILTYETRALKIRAAKRFGFYSYTEMTDWHNGLIGAAGIVALFLVSILGYFIGFEYLSKLAAYYVFFNMIPFSNLDGTQIFFGSRILWVTLAFISLVFLVYALVL